MNGKVDWEYAREAVGDSPELLLELIEIFFAEYPKLITGISKSIESEHCVDLRRFAHTLKGSLRYFGKTEAGKLSLQLEVMGRDEQLDGAVELFTELQAELDTLLPELTAFAASKSSDPDA